MKISRSSATLRVNISQSVLNRLFLFNKGNMFQEFIDKKIIDHRHVPYYRMQMKDELWQPESLHILLFRKKRFLGEHTYMGNTKKPNFDEIKEIFG